jgi:hypothetical protein
MITRILFSAALVFSISFAGGAVADEQSDWGNNRASAASNGKASEKNRSYRSVEKSKTAKKHRSDYDIDGGGITDGRRGAAVGAVTGGAIVGGLVGASVGATVADSPQFMR